MRSSAAMSTLNNLMAQRLIGEHSRNIGAIMERLATGERINRAKDDPSGIVASAALDASWMHMRGEIESNDALLHRLAVTDGYYSVLADLTIDLEATVVEASAGDSLSQAEREALQGEADRIIKAIDHLYNTAVFKGEKLLGEGINISSGESFHRLELTDFMDLGRSLVRLRGEGNDPPPAPAPGDPATDPADEPATDPAPSEAPQRESPWASISAIMTGGRLNLVDGDLEGALAVAKSAREGIVKQWATIGRDMKRLDSRNSMLAMQIEANRTASSELTDADFAVEMSALVREQVLQQASIFVLQRSQDMHRRTLDLLTSTSV